MTLDLIDRTRSDAFGQKMGGMINTAALALMTSVGHRTGLFDTMAYIGAYATTHQIAAAGGLSERYVREWLGAMVTGGIVDHDPVTHTYRLPLEHANWLTRTAVPSNMAASSQWIALLGGVEDEVVAAFRHGRGVPYSSYKRFHEVMAEESGQSVVAALFDHILPLVPDLRARLERGIDVLDIGCGAGRAMIELAHAFPASRFTGLDFSDHAIVTARLTADERGVDNVTFAARDVAQLDDCHGRYDLVTAFDAIHDQAKPAEVLRHIAAALRPGGIFLMQDILASSHVHKNCDHPLGTFVYTVSCMHCMSVSLANGGPGLGAAWGKEKALEMLAAAGFEHVRVETLPHDPMNYYYIARSR